MYNIQMFSGPFTVPLRGIENTTQELTGSPNAQIVILLQKEDETEENHRFLQKFIEAIPFKHEDTKVAVLYVESPPSWSQIQKAFPEFYALLSIGFDFSELELQFRSAPYLLVKFKFHFLMRVPTLAEWKEDKNAKMRIWKELKTIPSIPKS